MYTIKDKGSHVYGSMTNKMDAIVTANAITDFESRLFVYNDKGEIVYTITKYDCTDSEWGDIK